MTEKNWEYIPPKSLNLSAHELDSIACGLPPLKPDSMIEYRRLMAYVAAASEKLVSYDLLRDGVKAVSWNWKVAADIILKHAAGASQSQVLAKLQAAADEINQLYPDQQIAEISGKIEHDHSVTVTMHLAPRCVVVVIEGIGAGPVVYVQDHQDFIDASVMAIRAAVHTHEIPVNEIYKSSASGYPSAAEMWMKDVYKSLYGDAT